MKLLPVHSTCVVTSTLVETALAHVMHVLVFTENTDPLGTSGVLVVVIVVTWSSKSQNKFSSRSSHFVCFGPTAPLNGLIYDILRANSLDPGSIGVQSDIWRSMKGGNNIRKGQNKEIQMRAYPVAFD
jgi:hypothetical protein